MATRMINTKDFSQVTKTNLEEGEKKAFCRCWQSDNFPYCDGSHREYNTKTGDNIGPIVVSDSQYQSTSTK